ncbi:uncharacterized protein PHACADRAFT_246274 [Phanerochaete carnosa HHB-10118-sp]|uniref:PHD-type domain-containing protein n=1 Tax=Phanerochaete carnosa (strain HHB-10118-sp) TaxID=650164 RepID=K5WMI6_PHACS|nr:uncharacterized protein PHACADRAFT_246274 [Phanerochaete carnosa HHB-10118-sp]EKM60389.1 hypothetical protein PHACADRAFT_246274 [Phanerochaete carnosa HHB-10118-sp]
MDEDALGHAQRPTTSPPVAARSKHTSQLPTPQSPSNPGALAQSLILGAESPIRDGNRGQRLVVMQPMAQAPQAFPARLARFGSTGSLMTPESSPTFTRRPKSSLMSSISPPSTPRGAQSTDTPEYLSTVTPRPSILPTPSPRPTERTPPSVLSSPFMQASELRTPLRPSTRRTSANSPSPPALADDMFSPSAPSKSEPMHAQEIHRPVGGEIQRLRMQMAADQAARMQETESRRPEYLRRAKRRLSDPDVDSLPTGNQENAAPSLGVVDSPAKGRRITLFQETSEESFEQSLLAGGYPSYGHMPSYAEPSTPPANGKASLSQRAMDWIQQSTPGYRAPTPNKTHDTEQQPSEEDVRKRRRLEAFRDSNRSKPLFPVYVEGRGRVLLDRPPEDPSLYETPTKKRSRRKKGGATDSPSRKKAQYIEPVGEPIAPARPNWLDQMFPWSIRAQERAEISRKEEEEKLKRIERYLERESDEDEEEDQSLGLPATDVEEPPVRRGRGKWVPLPVNPSEPSRTPTKRDYYPSDPADARAALLSKRSVRALAFRRKQEQDQDAVCPVCVGRVDGQELVQCDDCHRWFHGECIGVNDLAQLGKEEDPWYCRECLGFPLPGSSSPVYVPTDDRPLTGPRHDPLFFQGAGVQESPPGISWNTPRIPKTPVRGLRDLTQHMSSRSSWDDSSDVGPLTPSTAAKSVRAHREPSAFDPSEEPFDPTATPSRGMRFSGPFSTPKAAHIWPHRTTAAFQTPSYSSTGRRRHGSALLYPPQFSGEYDDSPVRHAPLRETIRIPKNAAESPLASRSTSFPRIERPTSPLARMSGGGGRARA